MFKRVSLFVFVFTLIAFATSLHAADDPFVGSWKLNVGKSRYGAVAPPKNQTRTVVAQGSGAKITFEGVNADGSKIAYSYTTNYDGKDSPVTGVGQPNGQDTIAIKRIDANTTTATLKKAGKVVATTKTEVSKDGKTLTIDNKGVDVNGKPRSVVSFYDKQ